MLVGKKMIVAFNLDFKELFINYGPFHNPYGII